MTFHLFLKFLKSLDHKSRVVNSINHPLFIRNDNILSIQKSRDLDVIFKTKSDNKFYQRSI